MDKKYQFNQVMLKNHPQEQQLKIKQRCYYINSLKKKYKNRRNHQSIQKNDRDDLNVSFLCRKSNILKAIMLILLGIIAFFLFGLSELTGGYQASIQKVIEQAAQNKALIDQLSNQFIEVKTTIQKEKVAASENTDQILSVAVKMQSKLSILQPKLKYLEQQTNVLELVQKSKSQQIKKGRLMDMMVMKDNISILSKKDNKKQQQHQESLGVEEKVNQDYQFVIPKNIWIYKQKPKNYLQQLYLKNVVYYSNLSEYRVHYVNSDSVQNYFNNTVESRLKSILELIRQRAPQGINNSIYRKIILLHFLYAYGGIIIDGPYALTEDLNWIKNIVKDKFCSRGNRMIKPQMVGFFNPRDAEQKKKFEIIPFQGMQQIEKYAYQFPVFEEFFIASVKKSRFLSQVFDKIYEMFDNNSVILMKDQYEIKSIRSQQAYSLVFFVASKIVLRQKQKQLDLIAQDGYKHFAYDYYGLNFINSYYGPMKMEMIYEDFYFLIQPNPQLSRHRIYHDMARYSSEEWNTLVGNSRYLFSLTLENSMNKYLQETSAGKDISIHQGSFIQKLFYPEDKHYFIVNNPQKPFTNETNPLWESLPKYIWVFWYTGIKTAPIFTQACYQNLKKAAQESGFQLREVNDKNLHTYLGQDIIARIGNSVSGTKIDPHLQTKSNFYRLALLYYHGGIYLDATTIALQDFDWVLKIGRFPSQYIVNRFGTLPKVLMMWHPYFGQPQEWHFHNIDKQKNVKQQWHQSLQNGLLIAEKGSQFIGDWLQAMFEVHSKPYMQVERLYTASGISKHKSTYQDFHYLIAMDTGKYVVGKKQKQIEKMKETDWINAPHYYHLWTFSGYLNPMKLWVKSNYENPMGQINDLIFKYPLSYVEQIVGKTRFVSKFFGYQTSGMNKFIMENHGNLSRVVHSQSIFMKYIWRQDFKITNKVDGFELQFKHN